MYYILILFNFDLRKGPSIKDVRSQEGGGLSNTDGHFTDKKRFFRCGRPHFLVKKLRIFRNLWCVLTDKGGGGGEPVRTGGGGQFFEILCGRLLWTAPKKD